MTGIQKYTRATPMTRVELAEARQALSEKIGYAVVAAWELFRQRNRLPEVWLSQRLNRNKANLNKALKAPEYLTLNTISEILSAIDADLEFEITFRERENESRD
jgi:hypothetical protein